MKKIKGELTYSPTQGRQILDDLLLIWFYFSITKDQHSQQRDIFLDLALLEPNKKVNTNQAASSIIINHFTLRSIEQG